MKRIAALFLFVVLLGLPAIGRAQDEEEPHESSSRRGGPFGVGIILGEPTALTAKFMLNDTNGFQVHLGYGYGYYSHGHFALALDYLFHIHGVIPRASPGLFLPYVGVGGRLGFGGGYKGNEGRGASFGIHIPLGLSLFLHVAPIEIFVEVAPGIGLIPGTFALIDGGIGGRFYF